MPEQCNHENGCSCHLAGGSMPPPPYVANPYGASSPQPQSFAPHPYPAGVPGQQPSWASTVGSARSRRRSWRIGGAAVAILGLLVATVLVTWHIRGDHRNSNATRTAQNVVAAMDPNGADPNAAANAGANTTNSNADAGSNPAGTAPDSGTGDLTKGAVFVQSNDQTANTVVAFARRANGTLTEVGRYPTGGKGTGSFEDSADGIVLGSADGEASPTQNIAYGNLLFVSNAGSGTITIFQVSAGGLEKISETPSGGKRPVSLTVNNGLLYVLNSGEVDRRLILGPTTALENCAHDNPPSVTGFRVTPDGTLQAIDGSTRLLSGVQRSGCAQVSFTPDGRHLVVSERISSGAGDANAEKGVLDTFAVQYDGTLGDRQINDPSGAGPFGFTFTKDGKLLSSEQNGGFGNPGGGKASSYTINADGTLNQISRSVANGETDSCWITVTGDGREAFVASPFGDGRIASYSVSSTGALRLQHQVASAADGKNSKADNLPDGATDLALSSDSHYLYQLDSFTGQLFAFKVQPNGVLGFIEQHQVFSLEPFGAGGEAAPFGIAAH